MSATPQTQHRIFLVDDHPMVREWLGHLITSQPDLVVCGEASSRPEALERIGPAAASLVIVDITLKQSNGLELIKDLRTLHPDLPVLVLSMHDESIYAERVIRAGASGYINKQELTTHVVAAIRKILAGQVYLSEEATSRLLSRTRLGAPAGHSPVEKLADRELSVFELIGKGRTSRQIAEELGIGIKTVESYRARIKEKLQLANATELVQHAIQWIHDLPSR
jgi:DNA-binding NarL/FixJ family response regulator